MRCQLTRLNNLKTSAWSGGKTTQFFLHPPNSSYAARNFEIRISSATVDLEQSTFTSLPGYQRILMPLDAPMRLEYRGHGGIALRPYEVAEFDGGWETVSYGKCTDMGIMLTSGWKGSLLTIGGGEYRIDPGFAGVYLLAEKASVTVRSNTASHTAEMRTGDFLLVECDQDTLLTLQSEEDTAAVLARVEKQSINS